MSTLKEKAEQILQEKNEKIISENFSNNLTIFDVSGTLEEFAFVNADDLNGQITINEGTSQDTDGSSYASIQLMGRDIRNCDKYIVNNNGGNDVAINMHSTSLAQSVGLTPEKIKKDETILGVTGTLESGFNEYGNYINSIAGSYDLCSKNLWPHHNISPNAEIFGFIETIGGISIQDTGANGVRLYGTFSIEKIIDSSNNPTVYIVLVDDRNNVLGYTSAKLGPTTKAWDKVIVNQSVLYKVDGTRVTIEELMTLRTVQLTLTEPSA